MNVENRYEGNKILVPLFFDEVLKSFSFLQSEYDYNSELGIEAWEKGELKQVSRDAINNES